MIQGLRLCAEGRDRVLGGQILAGLSISPPTSAAPTRGGGTGPGRSRHREGGSPAPD